MKVFFTEIFKHISRKNLTIFFFGVVTMQPAIKTKVFISILQVFVNYEFVPYKKNEKRKDNLTIRLYGLDI